MSAHHIPIQHGALTAMFQQQWWLAYSYIEQTRRTVVNLAHLRHDFTCEPSGYVRVEQDVPHVLLMRLQATFCPLDPAAMLRAAEAITCVSADRPGSSNATRH